MIEPGTVLRHRSVALVQTAGAGQCRIVCCAEGIQPDLHLPLELNARQIVQTGLGTITDMTTLITPVCRMIRTDVKEEARQTVSEMKAVAAK